MQKARGNKSLLQWISLLLPGVGNVRPVLDAPFLVVCVVIVLSIQLSSSARAATFMVNSIFDVNDLEPGNGLCVAYLIINPPFVLPSCTLRGAIEETNSLPGEDVIVLGSGTYRLSIAGVAEDKAATGDLDITDSVRIIGAGTNKTYIDADNLDRVFDILGENITVLLSGLTIINGRLPAGLASDQKGGAGIRNRSVVIVKYSALSKNTVLGTTSGDVGGGLLNRGTCSVENSTIGENHAMRGGGVFNDDKSTLHISSSTIFANSAQVGGGLLNAGSADLVNTTLSSNTIGGAKHHFGGAIQNEEQMQIIHCTIAENTAGSGGGISNDGVVSMVNTILSNNRGGNCRFTIDIASQGHNLDSDDTCGLPSEDLKNIDPQLSPLRDNGGPTKTHALEPGSPAIDSGQYRMHITADQRGVSRPKRKAFDIGAFEANNLSVAPLIEPLLLK